MPAFIHSEPTTSTSARTNVQAGACPLCGSPLHDANACDRCDWVRGYGHTEKEAWQNPRDVFAGLVSLLWPGAGHLYKGHTTQATAWAVGALLSIIWSVAFLMFFGFLILPIYWGAAATLAYFAPDLKHSGAPKRQMSVPPNMRPV